MKSNWFKRLALAGAFLGVTGYSAMAEATDIASTITELGTYKTAGMAIGVALLLWVLGKRLVKKTV